MVTHKKELATTKFKVTFLMLLDFSSNFEHFFFFFYYPRNDILLFRSSQLILTIPNMIIGSCKSTSLSRYYNLHKVLEHRILVIFCKFVKYCHFVCLSFDLSLNQALTFIFCCSLKYYSKIWAYLFLQFITILCYFRFYLISIFWWDQKIRGTLQFRGIFYSLLISFFNLICGIPINR